MNIGSNPSKYCQYIGILTAQEAKKRRHTNVSVACPVGSPCYSTQTSACDVVCHRIALVIIECIIEYGEDSLRGDRVGGVGQHGAEHVRELEKAGTSSSLARQKLSSEKVSAPFASKRCGRGLIALISELYLMISLFIAYTG